MQTQFHNICHAVASSMIYEQCEMKTKRRNETLVTTSIPCLNPSRRILDSSNDSISATTKSLSTILVLLMH
ncbi:hypothetical protein CDL12_18153 [Handroanthus impetiginosus]|uniref:Uncharacterized protein n=1 Tax=Handroanthus impetiginosus TaxID=429701 RepID=A0A2G9GVG0_9LAMI|nr:hypothetical protein CDL12_18153 [Handroanthus impetiginosus]